MMLSQAFKNRIASYRLEADGIDVVEFLQSATPKVVRLIESCMDKHGSLKINLELFGLYTLPSKDNTQIKSFNTSNSVVTIATNFEDIYKQMYDEILRKMDQFEEADSGWALVKLLFLEINICKMK